MYVGLRAFASISEPITRSIVIIVIVAATITSSAFNKKLLKIKD